MKSQMHGSVAGYAIWTHAEQEVPSFEIVYAVTNPAGFKPMLPQFPGGDMQSWPVGKAVGNVRNQEPALMEPIDAPQDLKFD